MSFESDHTDTTMNEYCATEPRKAEGHQIEVELPPVPDNPYEILGIKIGASKNEIKAAFKKRIFIYHPDKHNNSSRSDEWAKALINAQEKLLKGDRDSFAGLSESQTEDPQKKERVFWEHNVRNRYERVWTKNTAFWKNNERTIGTFIHSQIITRDGLTIRYIKGIYEREYLVNSLTGEATSAEYEKIVLRDGMIIGKIPNLEYLLDEIGE